MTKYEPNNRKTPNDINKSLRSRSSDHGSAMNEYINKGEAVLITGATDCGKSFITSALGYHACTQGFKVAYFCVQKLLQKTKMAWREGTIHQLLLKISKANLLILDDFGLPI